ncbi:MAG: four-carbon acid sugar kinase family protein [Actinophytocola sp.]|nr:four-carbon acid sugar kinase family protein [Actinophytocola sp.]
MTHSPAVLVTADDLTGGNATAAGFARAGMRAVTISAGQRTALVAEFATRFDAIVVNTGCRHCSPAETADRVTDVIKAGWPAALVCNRIDSTLRGNIGASTAAALRAVAAESGSRAVAFCAPAHPTAGRQTVEGTQLLDGTRLEETELARDPRSPVHTSDIAAVIRAQADLHVAHLPLSVVTGDGDDLRTFVACLLADGADVIVPDALTEDHLDRAAEAVVAAGGDAVTWISVDPGPASLSLARALGVTGRVEGAPVLAVSGSATQLTRTQLARLAVAHPVVVRPVITGEGPLPNVDATAAALGTALADAGPRDVVVLATVIDDTDVVDIGPDDAERLPHELARVVRRTLERQRVDGLLTTGGDVTAAVLTELAADGLTVEEELVPLAVAGSFVGGPWEGLPIVTKGGLVGDADTMIACVDHLRRAAEAARRQVSAANATTSHQEEQA